MEKNKTRTHTKKEHQRHSQSFNISAQNLTSIRQQGPDAFFYFLQENSWLQCNHKVVSPQFKKKRFYPQETKSYWTSRNLWRYFYTSVSIAERHRTMQALQRHLGPLYSCPACFTCTYRKKGKSKLKLNGSKWEMTSRCSYQWQAYIYIIYMCTHGPNTSVSSGALFRVLVSIWRCDKVAALVFSHRTTVTKGSLEQKTSLAFRKLRFPHCANYAQGRRRHLWRQVYRAIRVGQCQLQNAASLKTHKK